MESISRRRLVGGSLALSSTFLLPIHSVGAATVSFSGAASAVAAAFAQAALDYADGRSLASILGDPSIGDIRSWIGNAVQELEGYFRAELQQQLDKTAVDAIEAGTQGVGANLHEYAMLAPGNQEQNRYLIEYCDTKTAELIFLAKLHEPALFISLTIMSYRLMTLMSLYLLDRDTGHILSHRAMMDDFVTRVVTYRNYAGSQLSSDVRVGGYACDTVGGEEGMPHSYARCLIRLDGKIVGTYLAPTVDQAQAKAGPRYDALVAEVRAKQSEFLDKINSPLRTMVTAYDHMCRKAGQTYVPPVQV